MKRILIWVGVGLLLVILGVGLSRSQQGQVAKGEVAPDFELVSFSGETYQTSEYRGSVIIINFWASWCESCKPEAKDLEAAHKYYQPRGDVLFLGIDYVDTEPEALEYLQNTGALQEKPIERLAHMNPLAIDIYKEHDIDF